MRQETTMKKLSLIASLIFISLLSHSQVQQARWWYFGSGAGVDFNPGPAADPNGTLLTFEGCSSISGNNGTLLFYTDGSVVKNANHLNMVNGTGLMGGGSSTQSGQVIPYPGSSTKYYIFTQAQNVGVNGMRYSVVDMTLNGGVGAVTATKNIALGNGFAEKIAGVKQPNGYWVTTLKLPGDDLYAFEVTSTGVNTTPVISNTGINLGTNNFYGCMKANPQGTKLAAVHQGYPTQVHVYDFNKNNGTVTNTMTLTTTTGGTSSNTPYGVEFSPNGNLLYTQSWNVGDLKQFDLTAGNAAAISASQVMLGSNSNPGGGSLQTGPDGKLYAARFGQTYISQVANPDVQGTGAGYTSVAVNLSAGDQSRWGLPLFFGSFFGATIEVVDNCYGDSTLFIADTTNVDSMFWNFGDTLSGASNFAYGLDTVSHLYTDTGTYTVTLVVYSGISTDTIVESVFIYPRQWADLGNDTTLCVGLEFTLDQEQPYATYEWHDGSTDSAYTVRHPDNMVMVTVSGVCDTVADTMMANFFYPFNLDIGNDTFMCTYDQINLNTGLINSSSTIFNHQWSTGATSNSIVTTGTGTYMVTVDDGTCTYADTINIAHYPEVTVELGNDSTFCYESQVNLSPKSQSNVVNYKWSSGNANGGVLSTNNNLDVFQTDMYYVTVSGMGDFCYAYDSVEWSMWHEPTVSLGNDTSFCHTDILPLEPVATSAFPMEYLWNDNSNNPTLNVNLVGLYWVEVSDENCSTRDSIIVDQYPRLDVTLGEDVNTCEGKNVTLTAQTSLPVTNYVWNDGSTNTTLKVGGHGTYTLTVDNGLCSNSDEINVFYHDYPGTDLGPDTAICPNDFITLDVTEPLELIEYSWSTGSRSPVEKLAPTEETVYWVKATNVVCTTVDSIRISIRDVPNTFLGADTAICQDDELKLTVMDDDRIIGYEWSNGETTQSTKVSDTAEYTVLVYDGHCYTPGSINVEYKDSPTEADVKLDVPNTICIGETIPMSVLDSRFSAYEWQDGSTTPNFTATTDGIYWVKATHACGVLSDTIQIDRCECPIWAPTAFNPDGNDLNDRFILKSDCRFIDFKFTVYNRWGETVFYTEDPNESWDGKYLNTECQEGTYSWIATYTANREGEIIEEKETGTVLMLR
ncbi:MAG: T9SS C-terminal target domain-containing protein [Salibacteraceae bacterium]